MNLLALTKCLEHKFLRLDRYFGQRVIQWSMVEKSIPLVAQERIDDLGE